MPGGYRGAGHVPPRRPMCVVHDLPDCAC
jgi:hypothetical protein